MPPETKSLQAAIDDVESELLERFPQLSWNFCSEQLRRAIAAFIVDRDRLPRTP
jgi:hypothetical protein